MSTDNQNIPPPFNIKPILSDWKILIVSQDEHIHANIGQLLESFTYRNMKVAVFNAFTVKDAKETYEKNPDIALVLLGLLEKKAESALEIIQFIRDESGNKFTRFVLCVKNQELPLSLDVLRLYDIEEFKVHCRLNKEIVTIVVLATLRIFDTMTKADASCWHLSKDLQRQAIKLEGKNDDLMRLTKAFETTEVGITITDNQQRIVYVNPADAKTHGFTVDELIGQPSNIFAVKESIVPGDLGKQNVNFNTYVNWKRDRHNIRKDGSIFPVTLISNVIKNSQGENIGMVVVCEDITERKKAEKALKNSAKRLEDMNATKDKFFSIIGHDLRNPLTTLMGYSELIVERFDSLPTEVLKKMLTELNTSSEHLHKLIENLLEWSRVQSGKIGFNPRQINLNEVVQDTIALLKTSIDAKEILVDSLISPESVVYVDFNMLCTILRNLLSNAIKFTESGGRILLSARELNDLVEVTVLDNGVGISEKNLFSLFRIDVNQSTRGTANESGTGLGLILCKEFIELHQGGISVKSEKGKGAAFSFTLPTNQEKFETLTRMGDI